MGRRVNTRAAGGIDLNRHSSFPGAHILSVPEIENMYGTIARQAHFFPIEFDLFWSVFAEIENTDHIIVTVEMADLKVPDSFVTL